MNGAHAVDSPVCAIQLNTSAIRIRNTALLFTVEASIAPSKGMEILG